MDQDQPNRETQDCPTGPFLLSPVEKGEGSAHTTVSLDIRHQGWSELPHGGILMSMLLELAHKGLAQPDFQSGPHPVRACFRWGGPSLFLDDEVRIGIREVDGEIRGWVNKAEEDTPYLKVRIHSGLPPGEAPLLSLDRVAASLEAMDRQEAGEKTLALPFSRGCFVCGTEREHIGLQRKFHCLEGQQGRIVFTSLGLDPEDTERLSGFRLADGQLHPGVLAAILDETLGWSGFVQTRQGGVTVRLDMDFFRPVERGEKLLFFGICAGTRGKRVERMFWFSEGGILPIGEDDPLPIVLARGQWLAVPKLTEEMKRHLMPREWTDHWFTAREEV